MLDEWPKINLAWCGSWKWAQKLYAQVCRPNNYCLPHGRVDKRLLLVEPEVPPGWRVTLPKRVGFRATTFRLTKATQLRGTALRTAPSFKSLLEDPSQYSRDGMKHPFFFFFKFIQMRRTTLPLCILRNCKHIHNRACRNYDLVM